MNVWVNILNELIIYPLFFASATNKFLIRKLLILQDLPSKQIHNDLNNFCSNLRLWENVSSFHPNDYDEWRRAYLQRNSC